MEINELLPIEEYTVSLKDVGKRIDVFLSEKTELTRSFIQGSILRECILVNGTLVKKNYKMLLGDLVTVKKEQPLEVDVSPEDIELDILFEDSSLLVVNKPKGMVVHPAPGNYSGTLVNALLYHCKGSLSGINGYIRPGIVHRIDKDTSGLLIVAKTDFAHCKLSEQISSHSFGRIYETVVLGSFKEKSFRVELPIGRHPIDRKKMAVVYENSKNAISNISVLKEYNGFSYCRVELETGRTHQIRVHTSHLGHPVLGDELYGRKVKGFDFLNGQCLLARYISFIHPESGKTLEFKAPLPDYFTKTLNLLEKNY